VAQQLQQTAAAITAHVEGVRQQAGAVAAAVAAAVHAAAGSLRLVVSGSKAWKGTAAWGAIVSYSALLLQ
jgi:hypothetical protein